MIFFVSWIKNEKGLSTLFVNVYQACARQALV